ncbi:type II toxin-antitoxin system HigB family toxin [Hyphomicrobium sp. 99]|uniref:type II toxin-antitoxin system HigB family toxin n=1 Tax=Hyphomicrobium sp. 99 TaxID=1163419 RepID=UPI0005F856F4|nr:type II toxin-antitoxin system HigB family toxin [Hyphomicrobium sp. 99]
MRLFSRSTLVNYAETQKSVPQYRALKSQVKEWCKEVERAKWKSTADIKAGHATLSVITSDRVVFNLVGNHYRLIVRIDFDWGVVLVCFIGTHKEYDDVDAETVTFDD